MCLHSLLSWHTHLEERLIWRNGLVCGQRVLLCQQVGNTSSRDCGFMTIFLNWGMYLVGSELDGLAEALINMSRKRKKKRMYGLILQSKGLSRVFSSTTINSLVISLLMVQLSHPYMTTGKTITLTIGTFVGKVTSLLFNMLSLS